MRAAASLSLAIALTTGACGGTNDIQDPPPPLAASGASVLAFPAITTPRTDSEAEFPGAGWIPTSCTNKCDDDRGDAKIEFIIIHDTEQPWDEAVATLQNDAGKSAHYIVDVDGRIAQLVPERANAWHCGNAHYNNRAIGIEHVGFSTQPFAEAQYAASARLVDYLATKYAIPRDREHVIGHDQVPNGAYMAKSSAPCLASPAECQDNEKYGGADHHTDPGVWEWPTYMPRFGGAAKCNDATAIWTCSSERSTAFRCANAAIEVATCDGVGGCEPGSSDRAAVCHVATTKSSPPMTAPEPTDNEPPPSATMARPEAKASGCSAGAVSLSRDGRDGGAAPWAAFAAVAIAITRRRQHVA